MNEADSDRMLGLLANDDYIATQDPDDADLIIVNTCSVRDKAYHKAISAIGKHNKNGQKIKIGVTGCVASQEGKVLAERFDSVDFVLGTDHIDKIREAVQYTRLQDGAYIATKFHEIEDYHFPEIAIAPSTRMVKAYVTIMKGCDNVCAFCIVPSTRGPEISRRAEDILQEIQALERRGAREITLLGQNVNSYGKQNSTDADFASLLRKVEENTRIERLRFTSPHPKDLSPRLIEEYRRSKILCRHIHLPAQSGSSRVLKRMRRAHTRDTYLKRIHDLRNACPDVAITTDLIVGFPGESDADFQDTLSLMREVEYDASYSFAYSERPGTEAAGFEDDVPAKVKSERLQALQALQHDLSAQKNSYFIGKIVPILVEGIDKKHHKNYVHSERSKREGEAPGAVLLEGATRAPMMGRTSCNRVVNFDGSDDDIGDIINIRIASATAYSLHGDKVDG